MGIPTLKRKSGSRYFARVNTYPCNLVVQGGAFGDRTQTTATKSDQVPQFLMNIENNNMTRILIAKEKHGDKVYDVSTIELLDAACLEILAERLFNQWYWRPDEKEKPAEVMSEEEIAALPEGQIRATAARLAKHWKDQQAWDADARKWYDRVKELVQEKESPRVTLRGEEWPESYLSLRERSDYEYEEIELVNAKQADLV